MAGREKLQAPARPWKDSRIQGDHKPTTNTQRFKFFSFADEAEVNDVIMKRDRRWRMVGATISSGPAW